MIREPRAPFRRGGNPRLPRGELVVVVDASDRPRGLAAKLDAHRRGVLHRAVSVFVSSSDGRLLLQRRAPSKYHCGGLWSNTCCGHPRPGEAPAAAGARRLREEMGIDVPLELACTFVYRAELPDGLTEHEYDYVYTGCTDARPAPNPCEVDGWRRATVGDVRTDLARRPGDFTPWFPFALNALEGRSRC